MLTCKRAREKGDKNICIIRDITNCIKGGYLAVITGDDLDRAESVMLEALTDSQTYEVPVINKTFTTLTFKVPDGKYRPYRVASRQMRE